MNSCGEIADAIDSTRELLTRFLEGFDDANAAAQPGGLPNHAVWTFGHLALTMHRAAERIAGTDFPLAWDPEPFAFGSSPTGAAGDYPPLAEMLDRYQAAHSLLVKAVREAGDESLSRPVTWGRSSTTARNLAVRMVFHNGMHCGQLVDLRRALGLGPVIR
jgi:hypothetical protein